MEELIRDMHKILTGNGNFNHGLIFKVASTNVNMGLMREELETVGAKVETQIKHCEEIQALKARLTAAQKGERTTIAKIGKAIWANKSVATLVILTALMFFFNFFTHGSVNTIELDKKLMQLDAKIARLMPNLPPTPGLPVAKP